MATTASIKESMQEEVEILKQRHATGTACEAALCATVKGPGWGQREQEKLSLVEGSIRGRISQVCLQEGCKNGPQKHADVLRGWQHVKRLLQKQDKCEHLQKTF